MKRLALLVGFLLIAASAHAQATPCIDATSPCKSGISYGVTVSSGSASAVLGFDGNRKSLIIANQLTSASNICVALVNSNQATPPIVAVYSGGLCNGFILAPGAPGLLLANYSLGNSVGGVSPNAVSIIGTTGSANVSYYFTD